MDKKVFLSVPLVAARDIKTAQQIADIIKKAGYGIISHWILLENPDENLKPPEVFQRDTSGVRKCDIFVADVSKPSHGVGMELMLARELKKKVICVYRQDTKISWMIKGLPDATLIEYADMDDLEKKLLMELEKTV